ncbi:hypothetical protein DFJ67_6452 [Asanoa ferruginea]|uniref:PknH-like protein n=1 Tax=Asanoa ferruginea TaxID=53367 RepID=A0A3D9ZSM8_9ACTN|nr:hypothetical protein [Asanoa ferruginea]REG00399.1 hypothetical protein DFJ67_6452 [Asanoa ferruginea]GIF52753.1 hypothetical protein Afe04nite_72920 [Asanoa ferruginea]
MRDFESGWAQLASEVDGTGLAPAADLRRAADKRAHQRIAVVTGAVVVVLAATGVAAFGRPGQTPPGPTTRPSPTVIESPRPTTTPTPPTPPPTGTPVPTTPPAPPPPQSTSSGRPITSIPDRAFVVLPRDMRVPGMGPDLTGASREAPMLCDTPLRDVATQTARRAQITPYRSPGDSANADPHKWVTQMIAAQRPGGAAKVMQQVRADLASCDTRTAGNLRVKVQTVSSPSYGDDAIEVLEQVTDTGKTSGRTTWELRAVIIRVGDIVTSLMIGDDTAERTDRADLKLFGGLAVQAIDDWR